VNRTHLAITAVKTTEWRSSSSNDYCTTWPNGIKERQLIPRKIDQYT